MFTLFLNCFFVMFVGAVVLSIGIVTFVPETPIHTDIELSIIILVIGGLMILLGVKAIFKFANLPPDKE